MFKAPAIAFQLNRVARPLADILAFSIP